MKTDKIEVIIYTKKGKMIFNLTEFEATTQRERNGEFFSNNFTQKIKGEFDSMRMITKKWWEFWK